uniref:Uncharacterized protein n=1 Tax=Pseudo-nitzschia delicatissima TaxID=44447 RepID=A0A7S0Y8Z9_9STRA|mmetsp:Transcript_830/g.1691  ORF Transcript_830/g.1691 Transcript_830/m.1691 type:complete len:309 (+) Transcript_830:118-1044(+)
MKLIDSIPVCLVGLLALMVTTISAQDLCTTCFAAKEIRYPDEQVCKDFAPRVNGMFQTDYDCRDIQLEAYQKGCCPAPPQDHCDYCADGTPYNPDLKVPSGQFTSGESCFDYKYANSAHIGLFEDGTCDDTFLRRAGQYCGCPNQVQECWLCPDKAPPGKPGKADAWVTGSNCRGIEFLFSLLTKDECTTFPLDVGADLAIYCGCGGLNEEEIEEQQETFQCELCRNGGFMVNPGLTYTDGSSFTKTCQQADDFAKDVIKTPYGCNNSRYFGDARAACCSNGSGATSARNGAASLLVAGAMAAVVGLV